MDALFTEHYEWAIRVAVRVIGDTHDAEDAVSEVFLAIHKAQLNGGGPKDNVRGYLRRAIQNQATKIWARKRFENVTDEVPEVETPDPAEGLLRALQRSNDLGKYPPMYALILYRMDILGESAEEASQQLHLSVPATKSLLHRARTALRLAA